MMSCLRANYVPFPISPRNSPSAVAHLISKARISHLVIGDEPAMVSLANDAITILKEEYSTTAVPDVSYVPSFEDLFISASGTRPTPEDLPFEYHGPDATACIMHSSGNSSNFLFRSMAKILHRFDCVPQTDLLDKSSHHSNGLDPLVWRP
jgi:acyl-CoA synthetase (AMP-forming)/AMP-acid ligase II